LSCDVYRKTRDYNIKFMLIKTVYLQEMKTLPSKTKLQTYPK